MRHGVVRSECGRRTAQHTAKPTSLTACASTAPGRCAVCVCVCLGVISFSYKPPYAVNNDIAAASCSELRCPTCLAVYQTIEFPERCALSFNACKEVAINAPHVWHTTYNIQRATCKEAILDAPHVRQTTYNIKHTTRNNHPPSRATERLHRTVHDTGVPHHATCNIQHIAACSGSHTTHTLLKAPYPHRVECSIMGNVQRQSTSICDMPTKRARAPPRHARSLRP